jgi:hypothetical protein
LRIEQGAVIWNDPTSQQSVDIPLESYNDAQFSSIAVKQTPSTFPFVFYDNGAFPLKTITVWPVPTVATGLRLWLREPLVDLTNLDSVISYPPGYERAIRFCLALELAPELGKEPAEIITSTAARAKADLAAMNAVPQYMSGDGGMSGHRTSFNWITGGFVPFGVK